MNTFLYTGSINIGWSGVEAYSVGAWQPSSNALWSGANPVSGIINLNGGSSVSMNGSVVTGYVMLTWTGLSIPSGNQIKAVAFSFTTTRAAGTVPQVRARMNVGGTRYFGITNGGVPTTATTYTTVWNQNPRTQQKWLVHEVMGDRKSTRLNSSHVSESRMPSSA